MTRHSCSEEYHAFLTFLFSYSMAQSRKFIAVYFTGSCESQPLPPIQSASSPTMVAIVLRVNRNVFYRLYCPPHQPKGEGRGARFACSISLQRADIFTPWYTYLVFSVNLRRTRLNSNLDFRSYSQPSCLGHCLWYPDEGHRC